MEIILETLYKTLDCTLQLDSTMNIGKLDPNPHSSFFARRTCTLMKGLFCLQKSALCLICQPSFNLF